MWIVKNSLKGTLNFRGMDLSIAAGEQFDLDTLGRSRAETSNQIQVAFEEGYLENIYKASPQVEGGATPADEDPLTPTVTAEHFDSRLENFKQEVLAELREHLPKADQQTELTEVREDMQALLSELKSVRGRFASVKGRIQEDPSLSDAEVKARIAFLEEQERELLKNFETVGRQVEHDGEDVMNKADLLANL